ncbi:hypothetical protein CMI38_01910 [Candidatus Pacearchaeota archaeon]|nr:hypothetical protein [Candidatus Pacearchaeota archaeon]|tara:strand:+ start:4786 stop:5421 length:636 start_codon:yes stop_codon:yes gene_type:complete
MEDDGVVKYNQEYRVGLPSSDDALKELDICRQILYDDGLIGIDPERYGGQGYGNVSQRIAPFVDDERIFIITGTGTGELAKLTNDHYTTVLESYPDENRVVVEGPIRASSESMTHDALYVLDDSLRFVFHGHSPEIWKNARRLGMPITRDNVEYGTPEMVEEVQRLFRDTNVRDMGIFSMGGHEDGIISFGVRSQDALSIMNYALEKSQSK